MNKILNIMEAEGNYTVAEGNYDKVIERIETMEDKLVHQIQGLVEINARFAQELIAIKNGGSTSITNGIGGNDDIITAPAPKKSNIVLIEVKNETLCISGNTYAHRGIFGENGACWNKADKIWNTSSDNLDSIKESLTEKNIEFEVKTI